MPTLSNAHYVDCDINGSTSAAVTAWDVTTPSVQKRAIAHPTNWAHLEGQAVDVLANGSPLEGYTISSGAVFPAVELVTNGDFSSGSTGWTLGGGAQVVGEQLYFVGTSTAEQTLNISPGATYTISMNISSNNGLPMTFLFGGDEKSFPIGDGAWSFSMVSGSTDSKISFESSSITECIVDDISVTPTNYHIGLNYISLLKPMKLNLEQMGLVVTKNITKLIVSFLNTLKGKCGTNNIERPTSQAEMEVVSFGTDLFTGIKEVSVYGGYEREGDLLVKQDEPLPMTCRGVIIDLGAHDK